MQSGWVQVAGWDLFSLSGVWECECLPLLCYRMSFLNLIPTRRRDKNISKQTTPSAHPPPVCCGSHHPFVERKLNCFSAQNKRPLFFRTRLRNSPLENILLVFGGNAFVAYLWRMVWSFWRRRRPEASSEPCSAMLDSVAAEASPGLPPWCCLAEALAPYAGHCCELCLRTKLRNIEIENSHCGKNIE